MSSPNRSLRRTAGAEFSTIFQHNDKINGLHKYYDICVFAVSRVCKYNQPTQRDTDRLIAVFQTLLTRIFKYVSVIKQRSPNGSFNTLDSRLILSQRIIIIIYYTGNIRDKSASQTFPNYMPFQIFIKPRQNRGYIKTHTITGRRLFFFHAKCSMGQYFFFTHGVVLRKLIWNTCSFEKFGFSQLYCYFHRVPYLLTGKASAAVALTCSRIFIKHFADVSLLSSLGAVNIYFPRPDKIMQRFAPAPREPFSCNICGGPSS